MPGGSSEAFCLVTQAFDAALFTALVVVKRLLLCLFACRLKDALSHSAQRRLNHTDLKPQDNLEGSTGVGIHFSRFRDLHAGSGGSSKRKRADSNAAHACSQRGRLQLTSLLTNVKTVFVPACTGKVKFVRERLSHLQEVLQAMTKPMRSHASSG